MRQDCEHLADRAINMVVAHINRDGRGRIAD